MIGSKLLPLAPRSRIANSSASANSLLGDAVAEPRQQRLERVVGDRAGGADAVDLAGVLHPAQVLDRRARGHELDALEGAAAYSRWSAQVTLWSSRPRRRARATASASIARWSAMVRPISIARVDCRPRRAARCDCLRVPAVGDEQRVVGAHEQRSRPSR